MRLRRPTPREALAALTIALFWLNLGLVIRDQFRVRGSHDTGLYAKNMLYADGISVVGACCILLACIGWSRFHWGLASGRPSEMHGPRWIAFDEIAKLAAALVVSVVMSGSTVLVLHWIDHLAPHPGFDINDTTRF